jgi:hypothetical protein
VSAGSTPGLTLAGEPRVQLLPPSVKEREKSRSARRMMGLLVVLALVVAGAGTGGAFLLTTQTETRLADAQARTLDILAQQAQYSAGAQAAAQVAATQGARQTVTANEVDWLQLTADVLDHLPCDCVTAGLSFTAPAPWEPALVPEGPLRPARVATMTLELESASYATAAEFLANVRELEGLADAVITTTNFDENMYTTTLVLTFDADILAGRYAPTGGAPAEETPDGGETVDAAAPAPTTTEGAVP